MRQNSEQVTANSGLVLVRKPVASVATEGRLEGTSGRMVTMLPRVLAVAERSAAAPAVCDPIHVVASAPGSRPKVEVAFYRKYTEAMLRKYVRMATGAGRVPALLGREMFRGNVTNYRVSSFEDVVLFCLDIERCLARLTSAEKELIKRVAMQEYSQGEAAGVLGLSLRSVVRQYRTALDRLTSMLLEKRLLEPLKSCQ